MLFRSPGPGTASERPHRPPALPSSWPCASPGHPSGLDGPCCIRFRHLRSKILGWTVLETSRNLVKSSIVAPGRAVLFHNGTFCQNRTAQGAHRLSRKELRACPSVPAPAGAEHPEARRNHAPKQEKRRAEERGSEADERRRRAGPTEPGGPPPPLRGGRAKRKAGRGPRGGSHHFVANKYRQHCI